MRVDHALKRAFLPAIALLLTTAAYFQARGIGALVGAAIGAGIGGDLPGSAPPWQRAPRSALASLMDDHATSAAAILERNPFDSITGPLLGGPRPPQPPAGDSEPDAICPSTRVTLIAASDEPSWSFAAIETGAAGARGGVSVAMLRRTGDEVGGYIVAAIAEDRVYLESNGARCEARLGTQGPADKGPQPGLQGGGTASKEPREPTARSKSAAIAERIRPLGDNSFEVDRATITSLIEQPGLLGSVRPVLGKEGGVRLMGIRPDSPLSKLGLKSGDQLLSINGFELKDPTKMFEMYARLQSASHLTVNVSRGGQAMNVDLQIR